MSGRRRAWALTALVAMAGGFGGCQTVSSRFVAETDEIIVERSPERAYELLFPYYADLCAVSQYRPKHKALGGVPGHAVMCLYEEILASRDDEGFGLASLRGDRYRRVRRRYYEYVEAQRAEVAAMLGGLTTSP